MNIYPTWELSRLACEDPCQASCFGSVPERELKLVISRVIWSLFRIPTLELGSHGYEGVFRL
jgi:hypothetical protein